MPAVPRSTIFAFKCKMNTPLTRLDFNLVLRVNDVRQLFYAVHEGVHHVCLRLGSAIPRTRFANALTELESKPLSDFERLDSSIQWVDYVYMGSEIVEGGEGKQIRDTIRQYWNNGSPAFFQSLSLNTNHHTNLIAGGIRYRAPTRSVPPRPRSPSADSLSDSAETLPITDSLSDSAETLPIIDSPRPRSPGAFSIQPMHAVSERLRLRDVVMSAIGETFHIDRDYNLPAKLREMSSQLSQLTDTVNTLKEEIRQMGH